MMDNGLLQKNAVKGGSSASGILGQPRDYSVALCPSGVFLGPLLGPLGPIPTVAFGIANASICRLFLNHPEKLRRHKDESVRYPIFLDYVKGKQLEEVQTELKGSGTKSGAGGPAHYRYVRDPLNGDFVIDMRHFLVVGPQTQTLGLMIEVLQSLQGYNDSAFDEQDFYSNALGEEFYFRYYLRRGKQSFSESLEGYFNARARKDKV